MRANTDSTRSQTFDCYAISIKVERVFRVTFKENFDKRFRHYRPSHSFAQYRVRKASPFMQFVSGVGNRSCNWNCAVQLKWHL